jgi:hypothetical protein
MQNLTSSDAVDWLFSVARSASTSGLKALAVAAGLDLSPMPCAGLRSRRIGFSLYYDAYGDPAWTQAFIAREIARRALECVGLGARLDLVPEVLPSVRRAAYASRAAAAASIPAAGASPFLPMGTRPARVRKASEQRLRPVSS